MSRGLKPLIKNGGGTGPTESWYFIIPSNQSKTPTQFPASAATTRGAGLPISEPSKPLCPRVRIWQANASGQSGPSSRASRKCDPDADEDPRGGDSSDPIRYNRFMLFLQFLTPNNTKSNRSPFHDFPLSPSLFLFLALRTTMPFGGTGWNAASWKGLHRWESGAGGCIGILQWGVVIVLSFCDSNLKRKREGVAVVEFYDGWIGGPNGSASAAIRTWVSTNRRVRHFLLPFFFLLNIDEQTWFILYLHYKPKRNTVTYFLYISHYFEHISCGVFENYYKSQQKKKGFLQINIFLSFVVYFW